ncbi:putative DNA-binding WGR domain protein [Flavobacterium sp. 9]|uniref:WGR domain-containing protein n=1 Tax=Flavobacterium sp. 9 TaxID=2035198 RepID=UPI000C197048|nr:WGR domain-containing protein [Flavobacterium sp. 9]PIF30639.1 putative DNA-binding WGR domain protein [Flavobacterium sp. 9]
MKLIKQIKLFYKEGNSDKVYEIDLCSIDANNYVVNFRYGRRGSVLKDGTKTPEYVSEEKAQIIFDKLENEKKVKGYASEIETLIDLPSFESVEPDSINGVILQRLEDAVMGKNSFKTQWKTSRVIWKAGLLEVKEAIPYIIKLASKGDDLQTYSAIWALIKFKSDTAEEVFRSYALQNKQKDYIKNLAHEGLLEILKETELQKHISTILETIPQEARYYIDKKDYDSLVNFLKEELQNNAINYLTALYLVAKFDRNLHEIIVFLLEAVPFRPPYFKHIRAIYKLAHLRNDADVIAVLAYRFENEAPMFTRTVSLEDDYYNSQFISAINERLNIGKELRGKDSKIAFSNFTKTYFQKNSLRFLNEMDSETDAKKYLKFAVSILSKYTENDYSKAQKEPLNTYGQYNYNDKKYYYTVVDYPECSNLLLLSTILFGNDKKRILTPSMKFILNQEVFSSKNYYFDINQATRVSSKVNTDEKKTNTTTDQNSGSVLDVAKKAFSTFFGKKETEQKPQSLIVPEEPKVIVETVSNRLELFPEHWDAFPEAYVHLIMEAQMNIIHNFAYGNLKARNDFNTIINNFDETNILTLLNSNFRIPNNLGFETIVLKNNTLSTQIGFIGDVLNSKTEAARNWAKNHILSNKDLFLNDTEFVVKLIFNEVPDLKSWITSTLENFRFTEDKAKAITGKVIIELLTFEESDANNALATLAIDRLKKIATPQLEQLSWDIVARLISSDLKTNNLLASSILILKSKTVDSKEIPFSLIALFLEDTNNEIRKNGIQLLNNYQNDYLLANTESLLDLLNNENQDVLESVIERITQLGKSNSNIIDIALRNTVYAMIRKEKFEGAHLIFKKFILEETTNHWNTALEPRDVIKLIHANYRESQLTGYEILKKYTRKDDFTIRQIISLGNHEILAIRQWCWNYFMDKKERIRAERNNALAILDTTWDDTRTFAFHFFKTEFDETDWDLECLISIVDSVLPAVEQFGKEIITKYFNPDDGVTYLTKLSQHPSVNIQFFVTNYLNTYATDNLPKLRELEFYFRSVLTRVHKARIAKQRIFEFLLQEGKKSEDAAVFVTQIIDEISATVTIQDKANCISILTDLKTLYPQLHTHLILKN